ncbi:MAG: hypothetical protein HY815_25520 [Candidatus Riflebacteria bacterium]|nr:hypothetical protein [Candidatus Riflebacteria bacterium]
MTTTGSRRPGITLVEALLGAAVAGVVLATMSILAFQATTHAGERAGDARRLAARDLLELALRRDVRRIAGGVQGVSIDPDAKTIDLAVLDGRAGRFERVVYRVDGSGRIRRNDKPLGDAIVTSLEATVEAPLVPGSPGRLQIKLEIADNRRDGPARPRLDPQRVPSVLCIVHVLDDGEVS